MKNNIEPHLSNYQSKDVISVTQLILVLWKVKYWIILGTIIFTSIGFIYAFNAPPIYHSEAIISPKNFDKNSGPSSIISKFGGLGSLVGAQLGIGKTNFNKIEILLKGRDLAKTIITKNNLLPILYPNNDKIKEISLDTEDTLTYRLFHDAVENLRNNILSVFVDAKRGVMVVGIDFYDPNIAKDLVVHYLDALNSKLLKDVKKDALINTSYLERQYNNTSDPIMKEKISNLIAYEMEKRMLVSTQSFNILEQPFAPLNKKSPKRKLIVFISFFLGIFISITFSLSIYYLIGSIKKIKAGKY